MQRWATKILACFLLLLPLSAEASEAELRARAIAVTDALARSDADQLATVLAPGFVAIDTRGGLRNANEFLSDIRATPKNSALSNLRRDWSRMKVTVEGDEATFVGRAMWRPADGSASLATFSILSTQRWRLMPEGWRLVGLQTSRLPPMPEIAEVPSGDLRLKAMLFRPVGQGPHPAIVYAHGNEPDPSDLFETVGPALASRGYLVVAPHRRGSGLSADQGTNLLRRLTEVERRQGVDARSRIAIAELEGPHLDDLAAGVQFAKSLPDVDPGRVFVIGNSFGGVLALLAAEKGLGLGGVADFAGAALNWKRSALFRERLIRAARNARIPVFLGQAENDFATDPTRELSAAMIAAGKVHRARIFPPFGLTPGEGHGLGVDGVAVWFDEVMTFLDPLGRCVVDVVETTTRAACR